MRRHLIGLLVAFLCLSTHPRAQTAWTIQASQVSGITNTTTTRNTLVLTGTGSTAGGDAAFLLNITGAGAATGTLQIFLEDSLDGGSTWNDLAAFAPYTFGAGATTQTLSLYGKTDGPGLIRSITGATPSAGAEISETVPAGARWELLTFLATFTASAAAATRNPTLRMDDGALIYFTAGDINSLTAGQAFKYCWSTGGAYSATAPRSTFAGAIPIGLRLAAGHRIRTLTATIDVGDQYSAIQYLVREWRDLPTKAQATETFPAGQSRSGPWGDRIRVREVVSGVGGSPTGPTYTVTGVFR